MGIELPASWSTVFLPLFSILNYAISTIIWYNHNISMICLFCIIFTSTLSIISSITFCSFTIPSFREIAARPLPCALASTGLRPLAAELLDPKLSRVHVPGGQDGDGLGFGFLGFVAYGFKVDVRVWGLGFRAQRLLALKQEETRGNTERECVPEPSKEEPGPSCGLPGSCSIPSTV